MVNRAGVNTRIEPCDSAMLPEAARMLARAFVTNPLHIAAFGAGDMARNEAFFRTALAAMTGPKYLAYDGDRLSGFIHWVRSSDCQPSASEKARVLPGMIAGLGLGAAWRVMRWLSAWSSVDPQEPHLHLGPIGVDPCAQGRRIGGRLMHLFCDELERQSLPGYLETDRPENVRFYEGFGFEVVSERPVIGVRNFFMSRRANGGESHGNTAPRTSRTRGG
jgi:ribosomal protein S18 acetylase RimI-like enzyme